MAKTRSKHQKDLYAVYKTSKKMEVNRKRKLTKLLKAFPANTQIKDALANISYRRKTPKTSQWSHTAKAFVKLAKTSTPGLAMDKISEKKMFMLGARATSNGEALAWRY